MAFESHIFDFFLHEKPRDQRVSAGGDEALIMASKEDKEPRMRLKKPPDILHQSRAPGSVPGMRVLVQKPAAAALPAHHQHRHVVFPRHLSKRRMDASRHRVPHERHADLLRAFLAKHLHRRLPALRPRLRRHVHPVRAPVRRPIGGIRHHRHVIRPRKAARRHGGVERAREPVEGGDDGAGAGRGVVKGGGVGGECGDEAEAEEEE
mmetsp:Transcript_24415/g.64400  ORF Transcript_24415/g.64400 Transcript_24415/m.64400 type:complete len:207 (+) Transcript_24415:613-1233(+)